MICIVCKQQTHIGQAYMLPIIERRDGKLPNQVACSAGCMEHWLESHPTYAPVPDPRFSTKETNRVTR